MNYNKIGKVLLQIGLFFLFINFLSIPISRSWQKLHETITIEVKIVEEKAISELGIERNTDQYSEWLYSSGYYPLDQILFEVKVRYWLELEFLDTMRTIYSRPEITIYLLVIGIALYIGSKKDVKASSSPYYND